MSKNQNKLIKISEDHSLGYELNLTGEMSIKYRFDGEPDDSHTESPE